MRTITATRYHDISCGHRVHGHEGKCALLHGHNYRIHFTCEAEANSHMLDKVGRVLDFSAIKVLLCQWLEDYWDHRFLAWDKDLLMLSLGNGPDPFDLGSGAKLWEMLTESIVWVPFNPTAENMAAHLLEVVGPQQLVGTNVRLVRVTVDETRKCSATAGA